MSIPLKEGIIGASLGNSVCMAVSMKLIGRGIKLLSRGIRSTLVTQLCRCQDGPSISPTEKDSVVTL